MVIDNIKEYEVQLVNQYLIIKRRVYMANEALIKVNGVALSTPSDIKVEIQDLDGESVRPVATGVLRRNRIRSNMLKVTLTWNITPTIDIMNILSANFSAIRSSPWVLRFNGITASVPASPKIPKLVCLPLFLQLAKEFVVRLSC